MRRLKCLITVKAESMLLVAKGLKQERRLMGFYPYNLYDILFDVTLITIIKKLSYVVAIWSRLVKEKHTADL